MQIAGAQAALGELVKVAVRKGREALSSVERAVDGLTHRAVRSEFDGSAPGDHVQIPPNGMSKTEVFARLEAYRSFDVAWRDGRTWAYVYDAGDDAEEVCKRAFTMYMSENGLDPTAFPSLVQLENEVVGMVGDFVNVPPEGAGTFTSGGTESIFMAVKAARDHARVHRPEVTEPEILLPHTAHASFQKAAHYLGLEIVLVPVDPATFKADPKAMRKAITPNTIMMVGSACSYAHGVVDPIAELGQLAEETGVWLHVDACIGGFVLQYFRRLGADVTEFDFKIPGVTSLSIDLHKYAFAAKGASVVLFRDRALRAYEFYACSNWSGYTVVNSTIQSTKGGGPVAAAWAMLNYLGNAGYEELFRRMLDASRRVAANIDAHPDLRLLAQPESNLVAFTSDTVNVFHIADEMRTRGWFVQPQLAFEATKENIHLSVNPKALKWVDRFVEDLDASVQAARKLESGKLAARVKKEFGNLGDGGLTAESFQKLMSFVGIDGVELPERMAPINEVLNALPPNVREDMLVRFLNQLYVFPGSRP